MTFISTPWANGDTITEVKLDQMVANEEHVRNEAVFKPIATSGPATSGAHASNTPTFGLTYGSTVSGAGDHVNADIDISSLTDGTLYTVAASGNGFDTFEFKFVKTPDINYLTYWVTLGSVYDNPDYILSASNFTVIAHKDTQGWTA